VCVYVIECVCVYVVVCGYMCADLVIYILTRTSVHTYICIYTHTHRWPRYAAHVCIELLRDPARYKSDNTSYVCVYIYIYMYIYTYIQCDIVACMYVCMYVSFHGCICDLHDMYVCMYAGSMYMYI
jgi:hypothetical protein